MLLVKPQQLELPDPQLEAEVSGSGKTYTVSVRAKHPALWVWLDIVGVNARLSDNFVHLASGATAQFAVTLGQPMLKQDFTAALKVRSLFDTYANTKNN